MSQYTKELEDLISDELIPMYIIGCRSVGRDPKVNEVLRKLLEARSRISEVAYLLRKSPDKASQNL